MWNAERQSLDGQHARLYPLYHFFSLYEFHFMVSFLWKRKLARAEEIPTPPAWMPQFLTLGPFCPSLWV